MHAPWIRDTEGQVKVYGSTDVPDWCPLEWPLNDPGIIPRALLGTNRRPNGGPVTCDVVRLCIFGWILRQFAQRAASIIRPSRC